MPGTMPATSQLAWLISTTAMIVLSCSSGVRDRLKSLSCCGMGRSIGVASNDDGAISPPSAHSISTDDQSGARLGSPEARAGSLGLQAGEDVRAAPDRRRRTPRGD